MPLNNSLFTGNNIFANKHLETIMPALLRKVDVEYERIRIHTPDGDFFDTDWLKHPKISRVVVLIHGLEGSSNSSYIKGFAKFFFHHGFDVCAINFRSCSEEMNLLPISYHSGFYNDFHLLVSNHLHKYKQVHAIGFSLGGNMLLHYLGKHKHIVSSAIKSAVAISVPIDLAASSATLAKRSNRIYLNRFLRSLKLKMQLKASQFPNTFDVSNLKKVKTFEQFDNRFTAPIHGFENAAHYYQSVSAIYSLHNIAIPTLLLNAQNDPFLSPSCYPIAIACESNFLQLEVPKGGGHVGFAYQFPNGRYWSEERALAYINSMS
jgi:predicted alpha/beta-fold hydrolase